MYKRCTLRTDQTQQYCRLYVTIHKLNRGIILSSKNKTKNRHVQPLHFCKVRFLIKVETAEHWNYNFYIRLFIYFDIYVWIYEAIRALPRRLQSGRYENYKECQSFFPTWFIFLSLLSFPNFFAFLRGLEAAFRSCEIKVHIGDLAQTIKTVFIYPVIHIIIKFTYNQLWWQII